MEIKLQKRFTKLLLPVGSLVAIAVAAIVVFINLANTPATRDVLIANRDLAAGESLTASDVQAIQIPIGKLSGNYLSAFQQGLVLESSIAKGQLVGKPSLRKGDDLRIPIRLNSLRPISRAINVGDRVDIWATELSRSTNASPQPVALNGIVTLIESNNSMTQNSTNLEVRIEEEFLESLLGATDANFQLSVILHETLADIG